MANPWFPFYVDDYERKTSHLTLLERGAYSELIRRYYMIGGPLPANSQQVHRMCRATNEQECDAIDYCLSEFFKLEADGYHNNRCDEEIACAASIQQARQQGGASRASMLTSEQRSGIAKKAADARWKTKDLDKNDACSMLAPSLQDACHLQLHLQKTNPPPNPLKEGEPQKQEPQKRKRRTKAEVLAPYLPEVTDIVNGITERWPSKQPGDGKRIEVDLPKLAERIDALLREPNVTREVIEESVNLYLSENKRFYKHPQFFFGNANGESAHWSTYAKMFLHQQTKQQVTQ